LIAIGAALQADNAALFADLRALKREVTVIAAAAAAGREVAQEYVTLLASHGVPARPFEPRSADALEALAVAPAVLFTGGSQDRLLQALFQLGEESPLLQAVLAAYKAGGSIIAVGGSANAVSSAMIAGGSSEEAICFGASPDPWYRGVVLQEGLGLIRDGLVDQYFVGRNRLARLLVACVEEGMRWGFGLAEDSGLLCRGGGHQLQAIGPTGFACLDLHKAIVHAHPQGFVAREVCLRWVAPGQSVDTASGVLRGAGNGSSPLPGIVERFVAEAASIDADGDTYCKVEALSLDPLEAKFNIDIRRSPEGRRSIPELDFTARTRRG